MDNKNKKLIVTKIDNNIDIKITPSGNILDVLELLGNATLQTMRFCVEEAPESIKKTIREDLYDKYNCMASNILEALDPEAELHPGLTEKAILEMENKLIDKQYRKLMKKKRKDKTTEVNQVN